MSPGALTDRHRAAKHLRSALKSVANLRTNFANGTRADRRACLVRTLVTAALAEVDEMEDEPVLLDVQARDQFGQLVRP